MFGCAKCGKQLAIGTNFCQYCGARVQLVQTTLSSSVRGDTQDVMSKLTPREQRKAQRVLRKAEKLPYHSVSVTNPDGSGKTWRELGFDIDEAPETPGIYYSEAKMNRLYERSQKAQSLEKEGKVQEAITLYKQNVTAKSVIPIDYERLLIIYRKRKDYKTALKFCDLALKSPACTNPQQDSVRRYFGAERAKLVQKLEEPERKKSKT